MGTEADSDWKFSYTENPLWKLKEYLKFTGWLQYCIGFFWAVPPLVLSPIEYFVVGNALYLPALSAGLFGLASFELLTCKFNLRPTEALPAPKTSMTNIDAVMARYSCRSYQSRNLTKEHREELEQVLQENLKGKLFDADIRFEYMAKELVVWPAVNCKEFIIAISPKTYSKEAIMDLGRALEKTVVHATKMGVCSCIIGPGADHASITETLGPEKFDKEKDHIICVCALGYQSSYAPSVVRLASKAMRARMPEQELFFQDARCTIPIDNILEEPYAVFATALQCVRWAPSSYNAQTTRGVLQIEKDGTIRQFDIYRANKSRYYATVAVGIWMANWELACEQLGLHGKWTVDPSRKQVTADPPLYDISWVLDKPINVRAGTSSEASPLIV